MFADWSQSLSGSTLAIEKKLMLGRSGLVFVSARMDQANLDFASVGPFRADKIQDAVDTFVKNEQQGGVIYDTQDPILLGFSLAGLLLVFVTIWRFQSLLEALAEFSPRRRGFFTTGDT